MPDVSKLLHEPGRVYWGVTDLTDLTTGTDLGYTEDGVRLRVSQGRSVQKADHTGDQILDVWYLGTEVMAFVTLKQTDDNALARAFPGMVDTGTSSGDQLIEFPGDLNPGTRMGASYSGVFVFVPTDTTNGHAFLARKAVTMLDEGAEINKRLRDPTTYTLAIYCLEDTSIASDDADRYPTRIAAVGKLEDLSIA